MATVKEVLLELHADVERLIRVIGADPLVNKDPIFLDMEERERVQRLYSQVDAYEKVQKLIDLKLEQMKGLEHDAMYCPR